MKKTLITAIALTVGLTATAQKRAFTIEDVYRVQSVSSPTVAKDGTLAYSTSSSDLKTQKSTSNIWVMNKSGKGQPTAITTNGKSYEPMWSQDGKSLYFCSSVDGAVQLFKYSDGTTTQITDYALGVQCAQVSPDGRYVAFAAEVYPEIGGADGKANKAALDKRAKNPIQAHVADALLYRHWTEYSDGRYWHIIVYNTETKTYKDITPGRFHSPVFSPSGPSGFVLDQKIFFFLVRNQYRLNTLICPYTPALSFKPKEYCIHIVKVIYSKIIFLRLNSFQIFKRGILFVLWQHIYSVLIIRHIIYTYIL